MVHTMHINLRLQGYEEKRQQQQQEKKKEQGGREEGGKGEEEEEEVRDLVACKKALARATLHMALWTQIADGNHDMDLRR